MTATPQTAPAVTPMTHPDPVQWVEAQIVGCLEQVGMMVQVYLDRTDEVTPELAQAQVLWGVAHGQALRLLGHTQAVPRAPLPLRLTACLDLAADLYRRLEACGAEALGSTSLESPALVETAYAVGSWLEATHRCLWADTSNVERRRLLRRVLGRAVGADPGVPLRHRGGRGGRRGRG